MTDENDRKDMEACYKSKMDRSPTFATGSHGSSFCCSGCKSRPVPRFCEWLGRSEAGLLVEALANCSVGSIATAAVMKPGWNWQLPPETPSEFAHLGRGDLKTPWNATRSGKAFCLDHRATPRKIMQHSSNWSCTMTHPRNCA